MRVIGKVDGPRDPDRLKLLGPFLDSVDQERFIDPAEDLPLVEVGVAKELERIGHGEAIRIGDVLLLEPLRDLGGDAADARQRLDLALDHRRHVAQPDSPRAFADDAHGLSGGEARDEEEHLLGPIQCIGRGLVVLRSPHHGDDATQEGPGDQHDR